MAKRMSTEKNTPPAQWGQNSLTLTLSYPPATTTIIMCGFPDLPVRGFSLFERAKAVHQGGRVSVWVDRGGSLHRGPSLTHPQCSLAHVVTWSCCGSVPYSNHPPCFSRSRYPPGSEGHHRSVFRVVELTPTLVEILCLQSQCMPLFGPKHIKYQVKVSNIWVFPQIFLVIISSDGREKYNGDSNCTHPIYMII